MGATASAAAAAVATRMPLTEVVARSYFITIITTTTTATPRGVSMATDENANNEIKSSRACSTSSYRVSHGDSRRAIRPWTLRIVLDFFHINDLKRWYRYVFIHRLFIYYLFRLRDFLGF